MVMAGKEEDLYKGSCMIVEESMKDFEKAYDKYYSGENRRAIFHCFCAFIESMRTDDYSKLEDICTENCEAHISTVGHLQGIEAIREGLKWPGPKTEVSRATIWNFVARTHNGEGKQTAYVECTRAVDDGTDVYAFQFGFMFSNHYVKENGVWKIDCIRADLSYEAGNNMFVSDKWILMDHVKYAGHEPMINVEEDNPWKAIPVDDEPQTDEEQIFDLMFRFTYAFDMGDFGFMKSFITDDFLLNEGPERKEPTDKLNFGDRLEYRDFTDFLQYKYHKEAQMMHAYRMVKIERDGDRAVGYLIRGEEHRRKNRILNRENVHTVVSNMLALGSARKGADGVWKFSRYRLEPLAEEIVTPDDQILYDEYIMGGERHE